MPSRSIGDLKQAIESAPEMTPEHRAEMLELVRSLERELAAVDLGAEGEAVSPKAEELRGVIAVAEDVVRRRAAGTDSDAEHDLGERLSEFEQKVEMVALEHPVLANVLAAIARLV